MGFKDLFTVLANSSIVTLICFTLLCSAAPTKQAQDREVLNWLEEWTEKLGDSARDTFLKYVNVRFSGRRNRMPTIRLGIVRNSFVNAKVAEKSPEDISKALCRQLTEFTGPVYLALYDESQRLDSNAELTRSLLNVSITLNSTLEMARNLQARKFPNAQQTLAVRSWSRGTMYPNVLNYKVAMSDRASVNELRSWATLSDVMKFYSTLMRLQLYRKI